MPQTVTLTPQNFDFYKIITVIITAATPFLAPKLYPTEAYFNTLK